jgi:hypothetical protein
METGYKIITYEDFLEWFLCQEIDHYYTGSWEFSYALFKDYSRTISWQRKIVFFYHLTFSADKNMHYLKIEEEVYWYLSEDWMIKTVDKLRKIIKERNNYYVDRDLRCLLDVLDKVE